MRHHDSYSEPAYSDNKPWPRTEADEIAEQKTEENWGKTHPGTRAAIAEKAISTFVIPRMSSELAAVTTEENETGIIITDRRRVTPESVEADFQTRQEALRAPLEDGEVEAVAEKTLTELQESIAAARRDKASDEVIKDLEGDQRAMTLLRDAKKDVPLGVGVEQFRKYTQPIAEQLQAGVDHYTSDTFTTPSTYISSMGGTVETGVLHHRGYNSGNLYVLARALQTYNKLQDDPKLTREELLSGNTSGVDYLMNDPVVVDTKVDA